MRSHYFQELNSGLLSRGMPMPQEPAPYVIIIVIVVQVVIYLSLFDDDVSMLIAFNNFQYHVTFHLQEQLQRT